MKNFTGDYPDDWKTIATAVKDAAGWRCVRCSHPHETPGNPVSCDDQCDPTRHRNGKLNDGKQRILTVHHLNNDKTCVEWWNLAALCQVCHLIIQAKVDMNRPWLMFPHSEWFKPYVAGFYAWNYHGEKVTRDEAVERMYDLLQYPMLEIKWAE